MTPDDVVFVGDVALELEALFAADRERDVALDVDTLDGLNNDNNNINNKSPKYIDNYVLQSCCACKRMHGAKKRGYLEDLPLFCL